MRVTVGADSFVDPWAFDFGVIPQTSWQCWPAAVDDDIRVKRLHRGGGRETLRIFRGIFDSFLKIQRSPDFIGAIDEMNRRHGGPNRAMERDL
jgi:hypothetical protein